MVDINSSPLKNFLDAVDLVLNSNTFLIEFPLTSGNIPEDLSNFIHSLAFYQGITGQDAEREWYNMYVFNYDTNTYTLKPGDLLKTPCVIKIQNPVVSLQEYLVAMLTANPAIGNFRSYYNKQINDEESAELVNQFLNHIADGSSLAYFIIAPDFLVNGGADTHESVDNICYFEGLFASDSATLITRDSTAFLLLTNGIP